MRYLLLYLAIVWALGLPILIYGRCRRFAVACRFEHLAVATYCVVVLVGFQIFFQQHEVAWVVLVFAAFPLGALVMRALKPPADKK